MKKPFLPSPAVRLMLERFTVDESVATPKELELIAEAEADLHRLIPCEDALARRWYPSAARLLVLGVSRSGLSGTHLSGSRGIIWEARDALRDALAKSNRPSSWLP